jgi:hypothetical protein
MFCGLFVALSVMVTAALRVPVADVVKVTLILQLPFGATDPAQLLVCAKSPPLIGPGISEPGGMLVFGRI